MNKEAIIHEFVSKPKVNRLPLPPARDQGEGLSVADGNIVKWSALLFVVLVSIFAVYQYSTDLSRISVTSPDKPRLAAFNNSSDDIIKHDDSTLYFRDNEGIIVGNMIKIASESEKMIPNKISSDGGRPIERELLSILSKY